MLPKDREYVLDATSGMAHILVLTGYRSMLMEVQNCHLITWLGLSDLNEILLKNRILKILRHPFAV